MKSEEIKDMIIDLLIDDSDFRDEIKSLLEVDDLERKVDDIEDKVDNAQGQLGYIYAEGVDEFRNL